MNQIFKIGDSKMHSHVVVDEDLAAFNTVVVHQLCSTFALAREIEWSSRQFVLEMINEDEEGIGTLLKIVHKSPAIKGEKLLIRAENKTIIKNEITCDIEVKVKYRIIATGVTGQKILKRTKIASLLEDL